VSRVVADTENLFDDCCCPSGSPKVPSKPVGFGTFGQKLGDLGLLFGGKPWLRTRSRVAAQCFGTSFSRRFEPLADCPRAHTQGLGNILLFPALLLQLPGPEPATFSPVLWLGGDICTHTSYCTKPSVGFS